MSRLEQMQANLQRRMSREKEAKMSKLYEDSGPENGQKGNVRRFFAERRDNPNLDSSMTSLDSYLLNASLNRSIGRPVKGSPVGWDKSFPLVPIERTNSGSSGYESVNGTRNFTRADVGGAKVRRKSAERTKSAVNGMRRSKSQVSLANGNAPNRRLSAVNDEKVKMQQEMRKREQELLNKIKEQQAEIDRMRMEKIKEEKAQKARLMRKPIPGSLRSNPVEPVPRPSQAEDSKTSPPITPATSALNTPTKVISPKKKNILKEKPTPRSTSSNSEFPACDICGRHFAPDRIEKHVEICSKNASKKRKVFDPVKMRTQGTEMESFVTRKVKTKETKKVPVARDVTRGASTAKSNWREKHESFLQTIRQAKVVQQHVASGGKASDLPPPPPMDTSDYVQCPHCRRKFNEGVAERHIPKCQNIKSNKK